MRDLQEMYRNLTNITQSPTEIMLMIIPSTYQTFATTLLTSLFIINLRERDKTSYYIQFFLDILLMVIPLLLDLTVLANENKYLQHIIFLIICILSLKMHRSKSLNNEDNSIDKPVHFVTNMRSTINLITVAAILAVDFPKAFPKRCHKTDYFGYSLMDVGVGLYVFSNGIVAPELHKPANSILKSVISSIPIIILGLTRLVLVTITGYSVNPIEYGVHWNFFMTLAVTKILSSVILNVISIEHSLFISVVTLAFHECLLQSGLGEWVFDRNVLRNNLIFANREGIISALGYVGLYFLSISIGKLINSRYNKNINSVRLITYMVLYSTLLLSLTFVFDRYFGVSRRLASAGYCLWIAFIGTFTGLIFAVIELCLSRIYKFLSTKNQIHVPLIYDAINYNGLLFFLLANILTGIINIAIINHKEKMNEVLIILFIYMTINCGVVTILFRYKIKITSYISQGVNKLQK